MIIYRITNQINTKSYIGQTKYSLEKRWTQHKSAAKSGSELHFSKAIRKYPLETWNLEILETIDDPNILSEREIYWIGVYNTFNDGYNSTSGGECGSLSEEGKLKISIANSGEKNGMYGKTSPKKGTKLSTETIEKMKKSLKGRKVWNKGIPNPLKSKQMKEDNPSKNIDVAKKISVSKMGNVPWNKGKKGVVAEETREKMRLSALKRHARQPQKPIIHMSASQHQSPD